MSRKALAPLFLLIVCAENAMSSVSVEQSGQSSKAGQAQEKQEKQEKQERQEPPKAHPVPSVTIDVFADEIPTIPVITRFATQFNFITEEQIRLQSSLDFYDALRNVPGVTFQKKTILGGQNGASLYIRGRGASHPSPDLNILFDDVPRSGVLYGQTLADGIPVYALGGMEIYKYPQPSRFGSGYGMINFIPKFMTKDGTEYKVGMEGGSYGVFAENLSAGAKKGSFDIYAAQSHLRTDGHVDNSAGKQTSYYLNAGYKINGNWTLRLLGNHVDASTEAPDNPLTGNKSYPVRFDTETALGTLTLFNEYKNASGYLKAYYNDTDFYLVGESTGGGVGNATSRQSNNLFGLRARESFWLWEGSEVVAGFDLDKMVLENRQDRHDGGPSRVWDFPDVTLFSPYLAVSQMYGVGDGFHAIPSIGLRFYQNDTFENKSASQAGLVLGYSGFSLNFNYARGVNYPSPVVLQAFLPNASLPEGFDTKKIKPEVVDHYEAGLTHTWKNIGSLSAAFFHDDGRDRTRAYMYGGAPDETFFNSHISRYKIMGMELSGNLAPVKDFELFAGAAWLHPKATGDDSVERDRMPYTPNFAFQTGFRWRFLEGFRLSGDYQHLQDIYADTSARTANPGNPASNFSELTDADKLPNVDVFNLRLDYSFRCGKARIKDGRVFLSVDNLFDAKYAYALETDGTQSAYYYMPGRTFMAGFELKF
jgi:iron complex outermembrane receptor protein